MSYLNQIKPTPQQGQRDPSGDFALPPVLPGQYAPQTTVLPRLRRRQLADLARAYGIDIDPDGTRQQILPIMEAAEMRGVFNQPPKNSYYFHKAKYSSDQIKDAKAHGGFLRDQYGVYSIPCEILFQWKGEDPEADRIKPHARAAIEGGRNIQGNPGLAEYHELKRKAVALGINTHEMTKDQLRSAIASKESGDDVAQTESAA